VIYAAWAAGVVLALAWLSRVIDARRGMRSVADLAEPHWDRAAAPGCARVSVIVPARDEEETIEQNLLSLLAQDYPNLEIIAVDDRSSDRTGALIDAVAAASAGRLQALHIEHLPAGWMGKPHAMWQAARRATGDWLLFTDADILFRPDCLRRAVAFAEASAADHLVLGPRLIMRGAGEKMMLIFFRFLFFFGHRPWKVSDPKARDHIGFGAFNFVRRSVYDAIGTHERLRFEVLDDMKLGKLIKESGFRQCFAGAAGLLSVRWGKGALGIVRNLTKNLFSLLQFRWPRTLGACIALLFLNLMPFVGLWLAPGWSRLGYGIALASIFLLYVASSRAGEVSPLYFFLHPVAALLFLYAIVRSMALTLARGGVVWRGTFYPLEELRRGMV
jgi:glycosyltransferase involved in cell wall biosynthesis